MGNTKTQIRHRRIMSIGVAVIFSFQQIITLPAGGFAQITLSKANNFPTLPQIEIPNEIGKIEEVVPPTQNGPHILHIQTAHGNFEAQKNIQAILNYLSKQHQFKTLFMEGGVGKLHPELMKFIPSNYQVNSKITNALIKKAELTGA